jgi:hypothetical protein
MLHPALPFLQTDTHLQLLLQALQHLPRLRLILLLQRPQALLLLVVQRGLLLLNVLLQALLPAAALLLKVLPAAAGADESKQRQLLLKKHSGTFPRRQTSAWQAGRFAMMRFNTSGMLLCMQTHPKLFILRAVAGDLMRHICCCYLATCARRTAAAEASHL